MSTTAQSTVGILLITVPLVVWGGYSLLYFLTRATPGYLDNPMRRSMFTAGHAHAGVLVLFALVTVPYVALAGLGEPWSTVVRLMLVAPPILMPLGFFLSVASPRAKRPNALLWLVYLGAASLFAATLTLGIGLLV
ncbi:hypothetical protein [Salinactinospora qingdaonensis]